MIRSMLASDNPLVKYGLAVFVVFGPLYLASSYGAKWAWLFALVIFAYFLIKTSGNYEEIW